jgi:hypothetical protein
MTRGEETGPTSSTALAQPDFTVNPMAARA